MDIIINILNLVGSLVCHQLPSRSIYADGMPLPLCARDTGIYLGVFAGMLFILAFRRLRSDSQPALLYTAVLCLMMAPMMIDGAGSYLGFFETNNTRRLITGLMFGLPLPVFLIPAANFKITAPNRSKVLVNPLELAVLISIGMIAAIPVLKGILPWIIPALVSISSLIFLIGRIVFTLISLVGSGRGRFTFIKTVCATMCVLLAMYTLSAFILQPLKAAFLGK